MIIIKVNVKNGYNVFIEKNSIKNIIGLISRDNILSAVKRVVIISDSNVSKIYAAGVIKEFEKNGFLVGSFYFEAGESRKNLATVGDIYSYLVNINFSRSDLLVALGGGVVTDITGFVASSYLRGVSYINIPTSLLAQIDASIGGKTGVNLKEAKNLVGAFYQPKAVIIDPAVLKTLDKKYLRDGMAEVIKYACIKDKTLFDRLLNENPKEFLSDIIEKCVRIKANIVSLDEYDFGIRRLLNFGHTFGHAYEKAYGYEKYSHGEAVAIGMVLVSSAGEAQGLCKGGTTKELQRLLCKFALPTYDDMDKGEIIKTVLHDKKVKKDSISLVLLKELGKAYVKDVDIDNLDEFIFSVGEIE